MPCRLPDSKAIAQADSQALRQHFTAFCPDSTCRGVSGHRAGLGHGVALMLPGHHGGSARYTIITGQAWDTVRAYAAACKMMAEEPEDVPEFLTSLPDYVSAVCYSYVRAVAALVS